MSDETATPTPSKRAAARKNAEEHFSASERRDTEVRAEIERERAAASAQIAKLRALRLAKEEADRELAANAPPPPAKTRKPRKKSA